MIEAAVHPLDREKLRRLGEMLCDISAGQLVTREGLEPIVAELMVCIRLDCSADGADDVLDRLFAIADDRLGVDEMAASAFAEIMAPTPRRLLSLADVLQGAE